MTPSKVKRWRGAGIIGEPERSYPGRAAGGGSGSIYGPEALERIVIADPIVKATSTLNEAVLVLFWRGHPVEDRAVRAAYMKGFQDLFKLITTRTVRAVGSRSSRAVADFVGSRGRRTAHRNPRLREWRERLPGTMRERGAALDRLLQDLTLTLLDDEDGPKGPTPELVQASGMGEAMTERLGEIGPIVPSFPDEHVRAIFRAFAVPSLSGLISGRPFAELEGARDDMKLTLHYFETFAHVVRRVFPSRWAFGFGLVADGARTVDEPLLPLILVPGMLLVREMFPGPEIDQSLDLYRSEMPRVEAQRRLLDALDSAAPDVMAKVKGLGPTGFLGLTGQENARLSKPLRSWHDANPEDALLILGDPPGLPP